jgi:hypothetical protein
MSDAGIQVFLSQSFRDEDRPVVELVDAIAKAFGFLTVTVDSASPATPPREAARQIKESAGLIAVVTRRDELATGGFRGPQAVHEEVAMADSHDLPVLLFYESSIDISGFGRAYGTYMEFDRPELHSAETLRRLVSSIRAFRSTLDSDRRGWFSRGTSQVANRFDRVVYGPARDEHGRRETDTAEAQLRYRALAVVSLWIAQELELANTMAALPVKPDWSIHSDTKAISLVTRDASGTWIQSDRLTVDVDQWALAGSRGLAQQLIPILIDSTRKKLCPSSS